MRAISLKASLRLTAADTTNSSDEAVPLDRQADETASVKSPIETRVAAARAPLFLGPLVLIRFLDEPQIQFGPELNHSGSPRRRNRSESGSADNGGRRTQWRRVREIENLSAKFDAATFAE